MPWKIWWAFQNKQISLCCKVKTPKSRSFSSKDLLSTWPREFVSYAVVNRQQQEGCRLVRPPEGRAWKEVMGLILCREVVWSRISVILAPPLFFQQFPCSGSDFPLPAKVSSFKHASVSGDTMSPFSLPDHGQSARSILSTCQSLVQLTRRKDRHWVIGAQWHRVIPNHHSLNAYSLFFVLGFLHQHILTPGESITTHRNFLPLFQEPFPPM